MMPNIFNISGKSHSFDSNKKIIFFSFFSSFFSYVTGNMDTKIAMLNLIIIVLIQLYRAQRVFCRKKKRFVARKLLIFSYVAAATASSFSFRHRHRRRCGCC
jgi:uncharacterized membrane protein YfcA